MKTKWHLLAIAIAAVFCLILPQNIWASGACTSARFHTWPDKDCNQNYAGAGGAPPAQCGCHTQGMPRWWVSEPYENLWIADTPLSYTMSSGKQMEFTFYYHQGYKPPGADEIPNINRDGYFPRIPSYGYAGDNNSYPANSRMFGMTNASWGNNWNMNITFWDAQWEGQGSTYQNQHTVFSDGYEALIFFPQGSIDYFNNTNGQTSSYKDPANQMQVTPLGSSGHPVVVTAPADTNGIYWGTNNSGFAVNYPDGSQDIYGLTYYYSPNAISTEDTAEALCTQRIDAQGRVTYIGYEHFSTPMSGYRVKYVVDPDGRTNTFFYVTNTIYQYYTPPNPWQLVEIDDPYGRKAQLSYDLVGSVLTNITDAAGNSSSFQYDSPLATNTFYLPDPNEVHGPDGGIWPTNIAGYNPTNNPGWITNLTTPYGTTAFSYYQQLDPTATEPDCYSQRAIYIQEPEGAQQLYYYYHKNPDEADTAAAPTVSGHTFDTGSTGAYDPQLTHRNTYYWGRRQFTALSTDVRSFLSNGDLSNALVNLTMADYYKADLKHWLLSANDDLSITEGLSSERDPSPDAAGTIPGLRTWYDYPDKPSGEPELLGDNPQISCVARTLPDGTTQYTAYNFYTAPLFGSTNGPVGMVSNNITTYSLPDGSVGTLTNWFWYASNLVDVVAISNSIGQFVHYGYSAYHQITSITNALNQVTTLDWENDVTHNLGHVHYPDGEDISLLFHSRDIYFPFIEQIAVQPQGRILTINAYAAGLPSSITDDLGLTVTNTWDGLNRLTSTAFPDGTTVSNVYSRLDLVATKDRLNHWSYFDYDGLQHLIATTNADLAETYYTYCGCGSLESIHDANGGNTYFSYDNQLNLTNVVYPDLSSVTYQYDLAGRMTNAFDGAGRYLRLAYNNQDLPTTISSAAGVLQQTLYDAVNRPVQVTDANGVTVTNQYDLINELLKTTWPDGIAESYGYTNGGLIAYTNRDRQVTRYGRDAANRLTAVTNANLEVTQFAYNSLDEITSLIDGLNHTRTWQYNQYGWLTNKTDALTRAAFRYAYNANGWVTNRWTPEKGNTGYTYDNVGNLLSINYPLSTIHYAYDLLNELTNMVDLLGNHRFGWTPAGQLQSESDVWTTNNYTYSQGLRTGLSIGSWSQNYLYDSAWRMTNTVSPAGAFNYQFLSANFYLPSAISLPNGASVVNSFDSLARLTGTALQNYWGHTLDGYAYTLDPLGLKTNIVRNFGLTNNSVSVGYDAIGQITSWTAKEAGGTLRRNEQLGFGYDAADNLHLRTNNLLVQTFNVDAADELTGVSRTGTFTLSGNTPAPATSVTVNGNAAQTYGDFTFARTNLTLLDGQNIFTNVAQNIYGLKVTNIVTANLPVNVAVSYDLNGNLTNDGVRSFAFDAENQLTNVTVAGSYKTEFVYDGLNRRRIERDYSWNGSSWVKTNEVHFIFDGYLPVQERDVNNNVLVTYTRGLDLSGSLSGAGGIGGLLAMTEGSGASYYYHNDGAGNITALMDNSENMVGRYLYNPFGKLTGMWGSMASANRMRFSSMPSYSWGSGFFGRFWLYIPQRWANNDPIGEAGGINLTVGMNNNPLSWIDPRGWQEADDDGEGNKDAMENNPVYDLLGIPRPRPFGAENDEPQTPQAPLTLTPAQQAQLEQGIANAADEFTKEHDPNDPNNPANPNNGQQPKPANSSTTYCPTKGTPVYRVWGNGSPPFGRSWTPIDPRTVPNYRNAAGLPPENSGNFLNEGTLTDPTGVNVKQADPIGNNSGGLTEFVIPNASSQVNVNSVVILNPKL